ncbi:MAG: hypothetical protein LBU22_06870 [Dysgonamonadaceae bacterium]|jgi:hypothetical protein|nr:hypothetical protein [Dysgonamonadaceae bacterium]
MKQENKTVIKDFKAVEYMRKERDRIGRETQDMDFAVLQKYFTERRNLSKVFSCN